MVSLDARIVLADGDVPVVDKPRKPSADYLVTTMHLADAVHNALSKVIPGGLAAFVPKRRATVLPRGYTWTYRHDQPF
jgi:hypothetical protein